MTSLNSILENYNNLNENCFLCLEKLTDENMSKEHILPKWLFKKYNVLNEGMKLGNNSNLHYRRLTIPACKKCNNERLNKIENDFRNIIEKKINSLAKEDEITLAQWSLKIMLGTILKETVLFKDQSKKERKILDIKDLIHLENLFILLQTIMFKTSFENNLPWSIFKLTFENSKYNYLSNSFCKTACFQFGKVGYAITFDDSRFYKIALENEIILNDFNDDKFEVLAYTLFTLRKIETKKLNFTATLKEDSLIIKSKKTIHKPKLKIDHKKFETNFQIFIRDHKKRLKYIFHN